MADDFASLPSKFINTSKQFDFAGVVALTRVAFIVRKDVMTIIPKKFTIRNNFVVRGVRVTQATKITREAEVFHLDKFLAEHEKGASRKASIAKDGRLGIPLAIRELTGVPKNKRIPKKFKARTIISKIDAGQKPPKIGGHRPFVFKTTKKNRRIIAVRTSKNRTPIRPLWMYTPETIKIDKLDWWQPTVDKSYLKNIDKQYDKALIDAFRTAI